jgi:hypothetical protein
LGTSLGSNVPARSRGVASGTSPTSVRSVFGVEPLREFGEPRPAGHPDLPVPGPRNQLIDRLVTKQLAAEPSRRVLRARPIGVLTSARRHTNSLALTRDSVHRGRQLH